MGITEQFSSWIVDTTYDSIPAKGIENIKLSILDWIGCVLLGSQRKEAGIVLDFAAEGAGAYQARVLRFGLRTTSPEAAFANGVIGHLEDFDDSGAHPASYLTPTVFSLGEELHLSGKQLLLAWALGYETSTRIRAGLHPDRSWHPTAILGSMGATAAASKLLNLDKFQVRMALGIAASETAGVSRNFGTMTKAFHAGNAARSGIVAAKLASRGFTADPDIIEARDGYADCFGGEKTFLPAMTQFIGEISYIALKGPVIKVWPCCSGNHATITTILAWMSRHRANARDIKRVEHYGEHPPGTPPLLRREVSDALDGKFCLEYNIAAAFIDGKIDISTFSDERFSKGDLQEFMKNVFLYQEEEARLHSPRTADALDVGRMRVFLHDGTIQDLKLVPRATLKGEAVVQKFRDNAKNVLKHEAVEHIISLVKQLELLEDTNELVEAIKTA